MPHPFASETDEIYYFKHLKPQLVSLFMYHHKVLHLELNLPKGSWKQVKKYYQRELKKVTAFFTANNAFIRYLRSGDTAMDSFYFLRRQASFRHITETFYAEIDPNCTTSKSKQSYHHCQSPHQTPLRNFQSTLYPKKSTSSNHIRSSASWVSPPAHSESSGILDLYPLSKSVVLSFTIRLKSFKASVTTGQRGKLFVLF
jgi:RteC protein